jgi:hypothetical protein
MLNFASRFLLLYAQLSLANFKGTTNWSFYLLEGLIFHLHMIIISKPFANRVNVMVVDIDSIVSVETAIGGARGARATLGLVHLRDSSLLELLRAAQVAHWRQLAKVLRQLVPVDPRCPRRTIPDAD